MRRAAFLDRDGVLCDLVEDPVDGRPESPLKPEDVILADGAREGLQRLREAGYLLVVASNQPAAAKGKATEEQLRAVHERLRELLEPETIDDWRYCFHRAQDGCPCRKPRPGMLLDAAREHGIDLSRSWMIGDTDGDVGAGRAAGTRTVLIDHPGSRHKRTGRPQARNLSEAAALVLGIAHSG